MKKPRLVNKKARKKLDGKCQFCDCTDYNLFQLHRWYTEGADGGRYTDYNCITCCANCHIKCHKSQIKILGKHYTTSGGYVVHYLENGVEKWA